MIKAGQLRDRLTFQRRATTDDGYGNTEGAWTDQFTIAANILPLKGGEEVLAGRLTGTQPVVISVRSETRTKRINAGWRAIDARSGTVYALTSPSADMEGRGLFLTIMATSGIAA